MSFSDFVNNLNPNDCVVLLQKVSLRDALVMRLNSDAALAQAAFYILPNTIKTRFRASTKLVLSFIPTRDRNFVLNGVYHVDNETTHDSALQAKKQYERYFKIQTLDGDRKIQGYKLRPDDEASDYIGRIVVRKPGSFKQGYVFYANNNDCIKMLKNAMLVDTMPIGGPMDLIIQLPLDQVASWLDQGFISDKSFLEPGVYMLRHTPTGGTYVGSAYGKEGLKGRWTSYANSVHGGNVELKNLVGSGAKASEFTVTTLEISVDAKAALKSEQLWKQRLLTTLNRN